jgi:hypothetical protein
MNKPKRLHQASLPRLPPRSIGVRAEGRETAAKRSSWAARPCGASRPMRCWMMACHVRGAGALDLVPRSASSFAATTRRWPCSVPPARPSTGRACASIWVMPAALRHGAAHLHPARAGPMPRPNRGRRQPGVQARLWLAIRPRSRPRTALRRARRLRELLESCLAFALAALSRRHGLRTDGRPRQRAPPRHGGGAPDAVDKAVHGRHLAGARATRSQWPRTPPDLLGAASGTASFSGHACLRTGHRQSPRYAFRISGCPWSSCDGPSRTCRPFSST